jgi:ABC-type transport system substrate-binding protein
LVPAVAQEGEVFEEFGPRVDELLIKIYPNQTAEFMALEAGEIDIVDCPLSPEWIETFEVNPDIILANYSELDMFVFDINNQRWPTNNTEFRRALAHLVDKDRIISELLDGYGARIDTPIPAVLEEYINPAARIYEYDPAKASAILDAAGFVIGPDGKTRIDPKTGDYLAPLIFYPRMDHPPRRIAGEMLAEEMANIGIPVALNRSIDANEIHILSVLKVIFLYCALSKYF